MAERAAQGKRTSNCVLGYDLDGRDGLRINPREAEAVRWIYRTYLECGTLYGTARRATAAGLRGKLGGELRAESVRKILTRPIYIGYNTSHGQLVRGTHEAIISDDVFERVQAKLAADAVSNV